MLGRFLSPYPIVAAILLRNLDIRQLTSVGLAMVMAILAAKNGSLPLLSWGRLQEADCKIVGSATDEQCMYHFGTNLLTVGASDWPSHPLIERGEALVRQRMNCSVEQRIGMVGWRIGRQLKVIDYYGLADAFVARLPISDNQWKTGHLDRSIPAALVDRCLGKMTPFDRPCFETLWRDLHAINSEGFFSRNRWSAILHLRNGYRNCLASELSDR